MKSAILILIGIVAVLLVGGAFAFTFMHDIANVADGGDYGTFNKVADKVDQVTSSDGSSGSSDSYGSTDSGSAGATDSGSGSDILSDVVKSGGQNDGDYQEVTYKDGGFRQYDSNGNLIGSSYDEDQAQLGVTNGDLE